MSNDERALLAAVCADPDSDLPRLVYADWLDDHGRHERAELIRIQCEMARLRFGVQAERRQLDDFKGRLLKLGFDYDALKAAALAELPPNRLTFVTWQRGFPSRLECTAKYLRDNAAEVRSRFPIRIVRVFRATGMTMKGLAKFPAVREFTGWSFERGYPGTHLAVRELLDWPDASVRELHVSSSGIDLTTNAWHSTYAPLAVALAAHPATARIELLNLSTAGVGDEGATALAHSHYFARLRAIDLSYNPVSAAVLQLLRSAFGGRLIYDPLPDPMQFERPSDRNRFPSGLFG